MQIKEIAIMQVENEFSVGQKALDLGNIGKARVCARRACMFAINYWLNNHSGYNLGKNVVDLLTNITEETSLPESVRLSAKKLITKANSYLSKNYNDNPLEDARIITTYFLTQ